MRLRYLSYMKDIAAFLALVLAVPFMITASYFGVRTVSAHFDAVAAASAEADRQAYIQQQRDIAAERRDCLELAAPGEGYYCITVP